MSAFSDTGGHGGPHPGDADRLLEVFEAVVDQPAEERDRRLDELCRGDAVLRERVAILLGRDDTDSDFLEEPLAPSILAWAELLFQGWQDRVVGSFRLRRCLGRGGMGIVYLAEHVDDAIRQRVAVKILSPALDRPAVRRRFRRELEFLSRLDHPSIARLLDGGTTPEGLPYIVMEYVEGPPVTLHCDRRGLSLDARLRLMIEVCEGVSTAHRNLVLHRDLKPSNILVTEDGEPKLLDFGIAKWLASEEGSEEEPATATADRFLTPDYASPELLAGEDVNTSSDVYSLGVILFELLTGRRPHDRRRLGLVELQASLQANPPRASALIREEDSSITEARTTTPERLRKRLEGDLDAILEQALAPDPAVRYQSPDQLKDDLVRHLEQRPVLARPPRLSYLLGRFLGRHRRAILAGGLAVGALLATLVVVVLLSVRLTEQRDRAEAEHTQAEAARSRAEAVTDYLLETLEAVDPEGSTNSGLSVESLLDHAARELDLSLLVDDPESRAGVLRALGEAYHGLGQDRKAVGHFEEAIAILRKQERAERELAQALLGYAVSKRELGDYQEAAGSVVEAIDLLRKEPGDPSRLATAFDVESTIHRLRGEGKACVAAAREAVRLRKLAGQADPQLAHSLNGLGNCLLAIGDEEEAEEVLRGALASRLEGYPPDHTLVQKARLNLANVLYARGKYGECEELLTRTLAGWQETLGDHPDVAMALNNLGNAYLAQEKRVEAEATLRQALAMKERLLGEDHPKVVISKNNLAALLVGNATGGSRFDPETVAEAEKLLLEVAAYYRERGEPWLVYPLVNLADLSVEGGRPAQALDLASEALEVAQSKLAEGHPARDYALLVRGKALTALGRLDEAEDDLVEARRRLLDREGAEGTYYQRAEEALEELSAARQGQTGASG